MKGKNKWALKQKLVAFFILVSVLPLVAGGLWTTVAVRDHLMENVENQNSLMVHKLSEQVEGLVMNRVNLAKTLANLPQAVKMDPAQLKPMLKSIKEKNQDIDAIGVINTSGMQIARSDDNKLLDLKDRSYFKEIMAGGEQSVSEVLISKTNQKPICVVSAPIKENGSIKGVIHISMTLDSLGKLISETKAGSGYSYIVDEKGRVVAHPDTQFIAEQKDLSSLPPVQEGVSGKTGTVQFPDEGIQWLAGYSRTPFLKWVVVTQQPLAEALSGANNMVRNTLVVLFLGALFAAFMGIILGNRVAKPVTELNSEVLTIAGGDLTRTVRIKSNDEIGQLAESVNRMRDNLREIVVQLVDTGHKLAGSSEQLAAQAQQTSAGAAETAATVEEIASTVEQVSNDARDVAMVSGEAAREAQKGSSGVDMLMERMNSITSSAGEASQTIGSLSDTLNRVNQIVDLITSIADQTNLLALNAAIEAARAGEQGRGFAVVAEEVRKLAEQSSHAAKEISQMIAEVQSGSEKAVAAMTVGENQVREGAAVVEEVGRNFRIIIDSVEGLADKIQCLASSAEQVSGGIQNVAGTTEEQTAAMEEVAAATSQLAQISSDLNSLANRFKV
ncbi:MAG: methyl-accepting chemotaxis protein [Bacillota bacterium]